MTEMMTVARGFIPARLRSSRKTGTHDLPVETGSQGLGLLRSRAGINPLATVIISVKTECSLRSVPWQWDPLWQCDPQ
ncbi:hypothetical protein, partial [Pseudomonas moraviensis]|uniref:hypothetical protein n=1 Tax=Pseudomonas moraviensis TaxID=321662 RepID=UPI001E2B1728